MAAKWIDNVNRKLDRCQVVQMSGRQALYLIASLPGKTAADKRQQQRIPLGLKVDDVGLSLIHI